MSSSTLAAGLRSLRGRLSAQKRKEESDEQLLHAFTSCRDDSAFAVLVRRYGPMVLRVCRRVLGHQQDAEDAFQATFLVLARNAASLRNKTALASWLHGIAYRTSLKAKQTAARRRNHEERAIARSEVNPSDELSWREVRVLLDEEIARLPDEYRGVFVLCCLENLSQAEAGRRLGLKERTVSNRLAEARKQLSQHLARRGVGLTAVVTAVTLAASPAFALSAELVTKTVVAASAIATGAGLSQLVSASVAELSQRATAALTVNKAKMAAALLLTASLLAGAGVWTCRMLTTTRTTQRTEAKLESYSSPDATPKSDLHGQNKGESVTVSGRVVDPEGKPATGARVSIDLLVDLVTEDAGKVLSTTTGKDGRFFLKVPRSNLIVPRTKNPLSTITIVATRTRCGPDWREVPVGDLGKELTLRLVKDNVSVQGRILSLEGKPLSGIKVGVKAIRAFPKEDLDRALQAERKGNQIVDSTEVHMLWYSRHTSDPALMATTGADGRFRLEGLGRERIITLALEGPGIHYSTFNVMTRNAEAVPNANKGEGILGATFEYLVRPSRLIRGTVREKGTGKPIAGIRIWGSGSTAYTETDAQGRYELMGCPKGDRYGVMAFPIHGKPYFTASVGIKDTEGLGPLTADLEVVSGIRFEGKVLDGETGQPVLGHISYYPLHPNPNVTDNLGGGAANAIGPYSEASASSDGSFHCIVLPGPGFLGIQARHKKRYMSACVDPRTIKALYDKDLLAIPLKGGLVTGTSQDQFQGILLLNPAKDSNTITESIRLAVAPEIKGTLLDTEGKPVTGARVRGLKESYGWGTLAAEKFSITGVNPQRPRKVTFLHADRRLIGTVEVKGTEAKPLTVRMQPWAGLHGRLVDAEGSSIRNAELYANQFLMENGRTDAEGRFRLEGLIPGLSYDFSYTKNKQAGAGTLLKDFVGKPGEDRDLGDVRGQPFRQE
jgi:RNA polymerase sigma factor (sigma-70 family)